MRFYRFFIVLAMLMLGLACSDRPAEGFEGTIENIENGKDGYVATLKSAEGERFEAIFSIPNMGQNFKRWAVGDALRIKGDTIHFNNTYRVIAREANQAGR